LKQVAIFEYAFEKIKICELGVDKIENCITSGKLFLDDHQLTFTRFIWDKIDNRLDARFEFMKWGRQSLKYYDIKVDQESKSLRYEILQLDGSKAGMASIKSEKFGDKMMMFGLSDYLETQFIPEKPYFSFHAKDFAFDNTQLKKGLFPSFTIQRLKNGVVDA
jgi:hypothetical protein